MSLKFLEGKEVFGCEAWDLDRGGNCWGGGEQWLVGSDQWPVVNGRQENLLAPTVT